MKKIILILALSLSLQSFGVNSIPTSKINITNRATDKFDIKIKNDTSDEVSVKNENSGGSYLLQKNIITTIKMEDGDKLYYFEKGKKGALILIANKEMDGKVQLLSKI